MIISVTNQSKHQLYLKAERARRRVLEIIYRAQAGHIGGSLSSVDILTVLYFESMNVGPDKTNWNQRDRFILSKGHSVESLYSVLEEAGFIDSKTLNTYGQFNSILAGHPTNKIPGIELNSGSLGHGLSVGVGMSLAARMDNLKSKVFVLMGDGEQGEGSIYEAAMAASHYKLDNLIAIIDCNKLQISGKTDKVMTIDPIPTRWTSFGWNVLECDGHNIEELIETINTAKASKKGQPNLLVAHTIKGKGVSFIENQAKWHHSVPTHEQLELAFKEIEQRIKTIQDKIN